MKVVLGDGRTISTGGHTVKNVAGYHLAPLVIGTHGRYGLVVEVTLKLLPQPQGTGAFRVSGKDPGEMVALAGALARGREFEQPRALALVRGVPSDAVEVWAAYEASPKALEAIAGGLPDSARETWRSGREALAGWDKLASAPSLLADEGIRWTRRRGSLVATLEAAAEALARTGERVVAFPGSGELWTTGAGPAAAPRAAGAERLRNAFKARFDPNGVFGPAGRGWR
jgi:FAD/FMN-containing dehydrogenase